MELEVKHLVPYLPYGLKLQYVVREKVISTGIMRTISHNDFETHPTRVSINYQNEEHIWMYKPLLKPLNTLTKEMLNQWYDGVAENEISMVSYSDDIGKAHTVSVSYKMMGDGFTDIICTRNSIQYTDYWIVQKMLENHFDVFGLIDAGLATELT